MKMRPFSSSMTGPPYQLRMAMLSTHGRLSPWKKSICGLTHKMWHQKLFLSNKIVNNNPQGTSYTLGHRNRLHTCDWIEMHLWNGGRHRLMRFIIHHVLLTKLMISKPHIYFKSTHDSVEEDKISFRDHYSDGR